MARCVVTESLFENMRHRSVCRIVCLRVVLSVVCVRMDAHHFLQP